MCTQFFFFFFLENFMHLISLLINTKETDPEIVLHV